MGYFGKRRSGAATSPRRPQGVRPVTSNLNQPGNRPRNGVSAWGNNPQNPNGAGAAAGRRPPPQGGNVPGAATHAPPPAPDRASRLEGVVDDLLDGPRDVTADVERRQGMIDQQSRQALMDQQASLGAAGFGTSGALVSLDAQARADAALRKADIAETMEQNARDDHLRRVGAGFDGELNLRELAQDEAQFDAYLDMIEALEGEGEPGVAEEDPGFGHSGTGPTFDFVDEAPEGFQPTGEVNRDTQGNVTSEAFVKDGEIVWVRR